MRLRNGIQIGPVVLCASDEGFGHGPKRIYLLWRDFRKSISMRWPNFMWPYRVKSRY